MSENQQNQLQLLLCGLVIGLALGVGIGLLISREQSPEDEVAQWVEFGFPENAAKILVTHGRTQVLPSTLRRELQAGASSKAAGPPRTAPAARPAVSPKPPPKAASAGGAGRTGRPGPSAVPATGAQRRIQDCAILARSRYPNTGTWLQAMESRGGPWGDLSKRVKSEVAPEQWGPALSDAWSRICAPTGRPGARKTGG